MTFADFLEAWEAEKGFGIPTRVFNAVRLDDRREILTFAFVDIEAGAFAAATSAAAEQEAVRHSRIDEVIESTELRAFYDLLREDDLSSKPRKVQMRGANSLLAALGAAPL
jgi:hypothetical protein